MSIDSDTYLYIYLLYILVTRTTIILVIRCTCRNAIHRGRCCSKARLFLTFFHSHHRARARASRIFSTALFTLIFIQKRPIGLGIKNNLGSLYILTSRFSSRHFERDTPLSFYAHAAYSTNSTLALEDILLSHVMLLAHAFTFYLFARGELEKYVVNASCHSYITRGIILFFPMEDHEIEPLPLSHPFPSPVAQFLLLFTFCLFT